MSSLVSVYIASNQTDAEIIRSMFLNAGIEAVISSDDSGGMLPNLQLSEGVDVLVDVGKEKEAVELLNQYRRGETGIDESQAEA